MQHSEMNYVKKALPSNLRSIGLLLLIAGIILGLVAYFIDQPRAMFNYLISYMFLISIGVGSLFLISLEYVANADWSVPLRRVIEHLAAIIPLLFILVLPLFFSIHDLFHWSHPEAVSEDKILQGKAPYLNATFFIIRSIAAIVIWSLFYFFISRNSLKQDETKDQKLTKTNIKLSAAFIPFFAVTITVSAIDWMMSLEPHWFSTIFGVYFFAGTVVASLAAVTLFVVKLKEKEYLHPKVTNDHLFSLGALMFAFVNFWAYIAFSQYLLIWYADLPEETFWFLHRWEGSWTVFSIALIVMHFIVPYAVLLAQPAKMDMKKLKFISIWLLAAHLLDLFWLVMPNMSVHAHGYVFSWIDLVFPVFIVGFVILVFYYRANKTNLLPSGDPKLNRALDFHI
ncbi:MAG: quinol:cytochrome C oxidoreductase [Ignavibacteriaceae bacterium]|nr:quinol:cytochrome C oxidoreductase [Ignavibacteriaceae bacterium]